MNESFLPSTGNEKRIKTVKSPEIVRFCNPDEHKVSSREVITYSESKLDLDILKKRGTSKTFAGWLIGKIKESTDMETRIFLQEIYKKYNEFNIKNTITIEIIDGWKGKDSIKIDQRFNEDIVIESHIKDKETNEVTTSKHIISKEAINNMLTFISYWEINESHKCYDFAEMLGCKDWKEVWKERTNIYFPLYYYPLKTLEVLGLIKYSGRGVTTRLR